jgi:hypothetical protein
MGQPITVACELCGSEAMIEMTAYTDATGKRIEWPKAAVKSDGIFFSITCPKCGIRDQLMAQSDDTQ